MIARRDLLTRLSALGVGGITGLLRSGRTLAGGSAELRDRITGEVVDRTAANYEVWRKAMVWHDSKPERYPDLIVQAHDEASVIEAVRYAAANDLRIALRSSGHNSSFTALRDGGMCLDVSLLKESVIDLERKTVEVQPGLWSMALAAQLGERGLAFPAAHCGSVPLAGYLLGGGLGWNHAQWGGVACHNIESADVVVADGRKLTVSAEQHPDLFWALRGAGPGFFGAVTRLKFKVYDLPKMFGSTYVHPLGNVRRVSAAIEDLTRQYPEGLEFLLLLMHAPNAPPDAPAEEASVCFVGITAYADSESQAKARLAAVAASDVAREAMFAEEAQPTSFARLYAPENADTSRGRYAVDNVWTESPTEILIGLADRFVDIPSSRSHVLASYGTRTSLREDACFSRVAPGYVACYMVWDEPHDDAANFAWLHDAIESMEPHARGYYINEIDALNKPERIRGSFSDSAWSRLRALRGQWDPRGVFHDFLGT